MYRHTCTQIFTDLFYFLRPLLKKDIKFYVSALQNLKFMVESYSFLLFSYRSENRQSLGELFVGFFKYYAMDFRYGFRVQHVACMRYNNGQ